MKTTFTKFAIFLVLPFFSTTLYAEELETGKVYNGPVKIEVGKVGFSFDLPKGWVGKRVGDEFLAQYGAELAILSVTVSTFTKEEALAKMALPTTLDSGVVLKLNGTPKVSGNKIFGSAMISTPEGDSLKSEVRVLVGKYGYSVTIIGFGKSELNFKAMRKASKSVEQSVRLEKPKKEKSSGFWVEFLANKILIKSNTRTSSSLGNGSSSTKRYSFCPNGRFSYYASSSYQNTTGVTGISGASNNSDQGTWIAGGTKASGKLSLTFKDGSQGSALLSFGPNGELLVDGDRWYRKDISCD